MSMFHRLKKATVVGAWQRPAGGKHREREPKLSVHFRVAAGPRRCRARTTRESARDAPRHTVLLCACASSAAEQP